jgi:hypothetical protein
MDWKEVRLAGYGKIDSSTGLIINELMYLSFSRLNKNRIKTTNLIYKSSQADKK